MCILLFFYLADDSCNLSDEVENPGCIVRYCEGCKGKGVVHPNSDFGCGRRIMMMSSGFPDNGLRTLPGHAGN